MCVVTQLLNYKFIIEVKHWGKLIKYFRPNIAGCDAIFINTSFQHQALSETSETTKTNQRNSNCLLNTTPAHFYSKFAVHLFANSLMICLLRNLGFHLKILKLQLFNPKSQFRIVFLIPSVCWVLKFETPKKKQGKSSHQYKQIVPLDQLPEINSFFFNLITCNNL